MTTQEKVNWLYTELDGGEETDMEKQLDALMENEGYDPDEEVEDTEEE